MLGFPEYTRAGIYNSAALIARRRGRRHPSQGRAAQLQGVRREALLPARRAADRGRLSGLPGRPAGLRGHLGAGAARSWRAAPARELLVVINASPYEIHKQREREDDRARARAAMSACRSCTSTWSAARTSWCSTATRSSWMPQGQVVMRAPAVRGRHLRRGVRARRGGKVVPRAGHGRARAQRRGERVRRAGARRPRLRQQARLPGRRHGPVGRRRLRADAGDRGRCARAPIGCTRS